MSEIPTRPSEASATESNNQPLEFTTCEPPPDPAATPLGEPPLTYDYIYPPSRNVITHNKERIARLKRCLACLNRRAEEHGQEEAPPITPANLSLCIGMPITTDHLRTLAKRTILEEAGMGRSSPFSTNNKPESVFVVRDSESVPYKTGQTCNYDTARYRQILTTRKPASLAILENIVDLPAGVATFKRADLARETRATREQLRDFLAKFTQANYITLVDARTQEYAITDIGQEFFVFTRRVIRVRTDNKAYYTEPNTDRVNKVLFRRSLSPAEQALFDSLRDIAPPYSTADITASHPFARSTVRSLFGKLEAQEYITRNTRDGKKLYYRLTAAGYTLLESEEEALRAEEQLPHREIQRRQQLIQHLLGCEFLRHPDQSSSAPYQLGPYSLRFAPLQVQAYLHANGLSPFVHNAVSNEAYLRDAAKQLGGTVEAFANIVASDVATAPQAINALDSPTRKVLQGILRCISCMEDRGVHQAGSIVATGDLRRCVGGSKRLIGIALRVLCEQDDPVIVRDPRRKRHVRYLLANPAPVVQQDDGAAPCQEITPQDPAPSRKKQSTELPLPAQEPLEQYPILKQTKERLGQMGVLNDDHILSVLQQCLDTQLLVVEKAPRGGTPQSILRNPTYDQNTRSYIAYNARLAALPVVARRAIAHHLGVDLVLYGQTEDPRVLKHAVGLASTDSLDDYARKIITAFLQP